MPAQSTARLPGCPAARIPVGDLVKKAGQSFLDAVGDQQILEPVHIAGVDYSAELADTEEAMRHLEDQYVRGTVYQSEDGAARFASVMARLDDKRSRLMASKTIAPRTDYRETGMTFRQRWNEEDSDGRRWLMLTSGFRRYCARVARSPEKIAAEAHRLGITEDARTLRNRYWHLHSMAAKSSKAERIAELNRQMTEVGSLRERLKLIPRYAEDEKNAVLLAEQSSLACPGITQSGRSSALPPTTRAATSISP